MRILLIVNTAASSFTARKRVVIQKALSSDHEVEVVETVRGGHASRLARAAAHEGVEVVAATHDGVTRAYTSHWVTQVSFEEPIIMASVSPKHDTYPLMKASGEFTVSFLAGDQVHIGQYFSYPGRKFRYIAPEYLTVVDGRPVVPDVKHIAAASWEARAITLADKLHNLGTMLFDLESDPRMWSRFNAPPDRLLWYYREMIAAAFQGEPQLTLLAEECSKCVEQLALSPH